MKRPPLMMRLRVKKGRSNFRLWLPLFLLVLPFLLLAILLAPIILIAALLMWPIGMGRTLLLGGPALLGVLCALRGLELEIKKGSEHVLIGFR